MNVINFENKRFPVYDKKKYFFELFYNIIRYLENIIYLY